MKKTVILKIISMIAGIILFIGIFKSVSVYAATDINAFPANYRQYISQLLSIHPNWEFVPYNTGIDWNELITYQTEKDRSLIEKSTNPDSYFSKAAGDYNAETGTYIGKSGSNWITPTVSVVMHYLDPRNFINENDAFMFLKLDYNANIHTEENVEGLLAESWMSKKALEDDPSITYAKAFVKTGADYSVSPLFLAARVKQEQGRGTSPLISGQYPGFEGYYNYYNLNAGGSTAEQIYANGLTEARNNGWNTRYKALDGGAKALATKYVARNQYTLYFQKFDVVKGISYHQYMQNIQAPFYEGRTMRKAYTAAGLINQPLVFSIPVYNNMPSSACLLPGEQDNPNKIVPEASIAYTDIDRMMGTISIKIYNIKTDNGIKNVNIKAYTTASGGVDIKEMQTIAQPDGTYTATISIKDFNNYRGEYCIEGYVTDNSYHTEYIGSVKPTIADIMQASMQVTQKEDKLYVTVFDAELYGGVTDVRLPVWSAENDQDDLIWYQMTYDSSVGGWVKIIDFNDHPSQDKVFNLHLYLINSEGQAVFSTAAAIVKSDSSYEKGDVNQDGQVNAKDTLMVLRGVALIERLGIGRRLYADVDNNNKIEAKDALFILQKAAHIIAEYPVINQ